MFVSNNKRADRNIVYLEILRIIACFFVVFNHTDGYHLFLEESVGTEGVGTLIHMSVSMITRINVPIFYMISGAVLLGKQESLKDVFKKRVLKIIAIIWVFSFFKYVIANGIFNFNIKDFVIRVIQGEISGPYWYLYAYLASMCMLPFIRGIAQNMTKNQYIYLLGLHVILASVKPILTNLNGDLSWSGDFEIAIAMVPNIFYLLMGYGINKEFDVKWMTWKKGIIYTLIAGLGIAVENWFTIANPNSDGFYTQNYVQLFDYLLAIYVFVMVMYACARITIKERTKQFLCFVGSLTFGMYLLDPMVKSDVSSFFYDNFGRFTGSFIYCIISMIGCGVITYIGKTIFCKLKNYTSSMG